MHENRVPIETLLSHREGVRALARSRVADVARGDDVEQETWVAALRAPPAHAGAVRAWLGRVVRHRAADAGREERRRARLHESAARADAAPSAADVSARFELHRALIEAVDALDEPYRSAIVLRFFEGLPPREIARQQGVPVETVRTRVKRGVELLRGRLDHRYGGDRRAWAGLLVGSGGPVGAGGPVGDGEAAAAGDAAFAGDAPSAGAGAAAARGVAAGAVPRALVAAAIGTAVVLATTVVWWAAPSGAPPAPAGGDPVGVLGPRARAPAPAEAWQDPGQPAAAPAAPRVPVLRMEKPDGAPWAGVELSVLRPDAPPVRARTDDSGRLALTVHDAGPAIVVVHGGGSAPAARVPLVLEPGESRIVLAAGRRVQLRFVDEQGVPVREPGGLLADLVDRLVPRLVVPEILQPADRDAALRLLLSGEDAWSLRCEPTEEAGGIVLGAVAPGRFRLLVSRPAAAPFLSPELEHTADADSVVDVPLAVRATQRVRFVDAETGLPFAATAVTPWCSLPGGVAALPGAPLRTNDAGELDIPLGATSDTEPETTWWLETDSHCGVWPAFGPVVAREEDVPAPQTEVVRIGRFALVEGKAYLASGDPAAGRLVIDGDRGRLWTTRVDPDGSFLLRVRGMVPGPATQESSVALVREPSMSGIVLAPITSRAGETSTVVLGRTTQQGAAALEGTVTAGGKPVAGVWVVLTRPEMHMPVASAETDASGGYRIEGLAPGDALTLTWTCLDAEAAVTGIFIDLGELPALEPGETKRLDRELPAGAFRVRVVSDRDGSPLARATVQVHAQWTDATGEHVSGAISFAAVTDADGRALLPGATPQARHLIQAHAAGHGQSRVDGQIPGTMSAPADVLMRLPAK